MRRMKITVELEHKEDINTPMIFADAVERFLVRSHEDEPYYVENFLEVVEHLNVRANYLRIGEMKGRGFERILTEDRR